MLSERQRGKLRAADEVEYTRVSGEVFGLDDDVRPAAPHQQRSPSPSGSDMSQSSGAGPSRSASRASSPRHREQEGAFSNLFTTLASPSPGLSDEDVNLDFRPPLGTPSRTSRTATPADVDTAPRVPVASTSAGSSLLPPAVAELRHGLPARPSLETIARSNSGGSISKSQLRQVHAFPTRPSTAAADAVGITSPSPEKPQPPKRKLNYGRGSPAAGASQASSRAETMSLSPASTAASLPAVGRQTQSPLPVEEPSSEDRPLRPAPAAAGLPPKPPPPAPIDTRGHARKLSGDSLRPPKSPTARKKVGKTPRELPKRPPQPTSVLGQKRETFHPLPARPADEPPPAVSVESDDEEEEDDAEPKTVNAATKQEEIPAEYRITAGVGTLHKNERGRAAFLHAARHVLDMVRRKGGTLVALDFEGYQQHNEKSVVQTGIVAVKWIMDPNGRQVESREYHHYCAKEYASLRPIAPCNISKSEFLPLAEIIKATRSLLFDIANRKLPCLILLHDHAKDSECLRDIFDIPESWLELFGAPSQSASKEMEESPFRVLDTQQMMAIFARIQFKVNLRRSCQTMGIDRIANLHNAINDAMYTMQLYIKLCQAWRSEEKQQDGQQQTPTVIDVDALVAGDDNDSDVEVTRVLTRKPPRKKRDFIDLTGSIDLPALEFPPKLKASTPMTPNSINDPIELD